LHIEIENYLKRNNNIKNANFNIGAKIVTGAY
jgi:hypothetical protein